MEQHLMCLSDTFVSCGPSLYIVYSVREPGG